MAEILFELQKDGIQKRVLYGAKDSLPSFPDGAKAIFHYCTMKVDEEKTVLDDSKHSEKPMELIFGKKFKLEVWEKLLKTMRVKEVAEFTCERKHTSLYPVVAKSLRDISKGKAHGHAHTGGSCCGMMAMANHGLGYPDLDLLVKDPQPLVFRLELLDLILPEQYEKESWSLNESEKLESIPILKTQGNEAYGRKKYEEAAERYGQALTRLEDLMLMEKPGDKEWHKLDDMKRPLLLNFSQCKLLTHDYYPVITHTSDVLTREPDNVKALFRRAKAHAAVWNVKEAQEDFSKVNELDPSLENAIKKELSALENKVKNKNNQEKSRLKGMFS